MQRVRTLSNETESPSAALAQRALGLMQACVLSSTSQAAADTQQHPQRRARVA